MQQQSPAHPGQDRSTARKVVLALIGAAGLFSIVPLAGWILNAPALRTFGVSGYPMWPLSAVGYIFLAIGFAAAVGRVRAAPFFLAVPLLIAAGVLVQNGTGIVLGLDHMLFPDQLSGFSGNHPGRPVANSVATFGLLGLALLVVERRNQASVELANLLASAAFCFGIASALLLVIIGPAGRGALLHIFVAPLPGSLITVMLATAFLLWRHDAGWTVLLGSNRPRGPLFWLILPLVIALPILPTLIARWGAGSGTMALAETELLAVLGNVGILGFLLWLSADRYKRQQDELQELTLALDVAAVALTRPSGEITYWSRGCEQLYGWSAEDAVGQRKYELLQSRLSDGTPVAQLEAGTTERELIELRRDGSEISVLERAEVHERPDREPLFVVRMLDISERVRTENALRMSEARLVAAADAHKISVSHWDVESGHLELSPGTEQRLGFSEGGLSTIEQWYAAMDTDDAQEIRGVLASAIAHQDEHVAYTYRLRQPNGQVRIIEGSSRCFYNEAGRLKTAIGTHVDVTERIEQEAASQLRSIMETLPDATVVIDARGIIRSFSPAAERMFGVDAAAAIGRNVAFLMPDAIAAGHDASLARYLETGERHIIGNTRELIAKRADGTLFPVELNVGEARLGQERIFTGVIRDVSDRLANEQRMSDLNSELAHISRQSAMSELAADLAHELNQPLSATANFLATARILIQRGEEGGRVADLLRLGEEQTLRSGEIIRRLRDFLAKREGEMRVESLEIVVREAVELVLFGTAQFDIRLTYALQPEADAIFADRIQIQQVLVNLLRNAVDALRSQEGKREIVIASQLGEGDLVEISVCDSGPGLPPQLADQLYSRFATTKSGGSMGIGLSISRRIVEAHGGTMVARNRPEGGAMFSFTVPGVGKLDD